MPTPDPVAVVLQVRLNPDNPPVDASEENIRIVADEIQRRTTDLENLLRARKVLERRMMAAASQPA